MSDPLFTLLMPTNYRPDVIGYAIQSVLDQTEGDFELFVVGDGAKQGTADVVLGFADPRVRWFEFEKAPGIGYPNRNRALRESRGRLVAFPADDNLMLPDHLAKMARVFEDPGAMWAYATAFWVSNDGIAALELINFDLADERADLRASKYVVPAEGVVYRASALPTREAWPEDMLSAGDTALWNRIIDAQGEASMRRVPEATSMHFSALRKGHPRDSWSQLLLAYLMVADRAAWWPAILKPPIPEGETEQAVYARLIRQPGWTEAARLAAQDVVNRIALNHLSPRIRPAPEESNEGLKIAELQRELQQLQTQSIEGSRKIAELHRELENARKQSTESSREIAGLQHELLRVRQHSVAQAKALVRINQSTSWRVTLPLRALGRLLRRRKP